MSFSGKFVRNRPVSAGYLRAFEAVARNLNFRAAAEELSLTQPAVSRQIQALEEEIGTPLLLRHTRSVELTNAGAQLLLATQQILPRLDSTIHQIRQAAKRPVVRLTTFASFASLWLIRGSIRSGACTPSWTSTSTPPTPWSTWTSPVPTSPCATHAKTRRCRTPSAFLTNT